MLHLFRHSASFLSSPMTSPILSQTLKPAGINFRILRKSFSTSNNKLAQSAKNQKHGKPNGNNARKPNIKAVRSDRSLGGGIDGQLQKKFSKVLSQDDRLKSKLDNLSSQSPSSSSFSAPSESETPPPSGNSKNKAKAKLLLALGLLAIGSTAYTTTRERIPPQEYLD